MQGSPRTSCSKSQGRWTSQSSWSPRRCYYEGFPQLSQRAYLKEHASTRAILVGTRELEMCREIGTYNGLEEPDKKVMRLVNAGGLWTGKHG